MNNKELFYFPGKCLSLGENVKPDKSVFQLIYNNEVNWDRLVAVASEHLALTSGYLRFKQQRVISFLMTYEMNYVRNISILKQIDKINELLTSTGIIPIYLKEAGNLPDYLHEDVGEQMMGDIDFLSSDEKSLQCAEILGNAGCKHCRPFYADMQGSTKHFPRLIHPSETADVEIHRHWCRLYPRSYSESFCNNF